MPTRISETNKPLQELVEECTPIQVSCPSRKILKKDVRIRFTSRQGAKISSKLGPQGPDGSPAPHCAYLWTKNMNELPGLCGPFTHLTQQFEPFNHEHPQISLGIMTPWIARSELSSKSAELLTNGRTLGVEIHKESVEEVTDKISLLPGLPDELTIDHIFSKVPWTSLCSLSTASKAWHGAISERKIYHARVRTNSMQTLVAIIHEDFPSRERYRKFCSDGREGTGPQEEPGPIHPQLAISLYDPAKDAWSRLPNIPGVANGVPHECECVCWEGKVFILGGLESMEPFPQPIKEVHMLDLAAGRGMWVQCASMQRERARFTCHVNEGKLFAFGGTSENQKVLAECEVFDIEHNVWRPVAPMLHGHTDHKVAMWEGQFYVHGGHFWKESVSDGDDDVEFEEFEQPRLQGAKFAEVYDPITNQWRKLHNFKRGMQGPILEVDGKLVNLSMSINHNSVEIYTGHSNSWISSQSISWKISESGVPKVSFRWPMYVLHQAIGLDNEVLAWLFSVQFIEEWQRHYLLKSKGLGRKSSSLEWEKMSSANEFPEQILCMRRINL